MDTSPSTYFSPFPVEPLPRSTGTMTDSSQLRSSISRALLRNHADFILSRSTSALSTLCQLSPCDYFQKRRKLQQTRARLQTGCQSNFRPRGKTGTESLTPDMIDGNNPLALTVATPLEEKPCVVTGKEPPFKEKCAIG